MKDYYQYFVNKGNHPSQLDILNQEVKYKFLNFDKRVANQIIETMIQVTNQYHKAIAMRIRYKEDIYEYIMDGFNHDGLSWLDRKEKVCLETKHSSYYIFLNNIGSHLYDYMINDDTYGICGGSFPLIINNEFEGSITVTGLRPQEDHQVIIETLKYILNKGEN